MVFAVEDTSCISDLLYISDYPETAEGTYCLNDSIVHWLDISTFLVGAIQTYPIHSLHRVI